jgi:hypothetical protein
VHNGLPDEPSKHEGAPIVAWEDRLRELDGEVASGQLSAEDYRRQRDELLASAGQGAQGHDPFPPPFRWGEANSHATQAASSPGPAPSADATQVVRQPQGVDATQIVSRGPLPAPAPPSDTDRTQVVRPHQHRQQDPPQQRATTPPWLTPSGGAPQPQGWTPSNPDFYDDSASRSKGKVAGFAVLGVLVVVLVVVGVLYYTGGATSQTAAAGDPAVSVTGSITAQAPTVPRPGSTVDVLATPPGRDRPGGGTFDLAELTSSQAVAPPTLAALRKAGMTEAVLKTSTSGSITLGAFVFSVSDHAAAQDVLTQLEAQQDAGGLKIDDARTAPGVKVYTSGGSGTVQYVRAVYVTYDRVVQLDAFGPQLNATGAAMDDLLHAQLALSPPTTE